MPPLPPSERTARGRMAESIAERFLVAHGYVVLARNVRYRGGELDLVLRDGDEIVFVEVRARRGGSRFDPAATVGPRKKEALLRASARWLAEHRAGLMPVRFDLVAVRIDRSGFRLRHLRSAFADDAP